jgi:hypothetical protein
MNEFRDAARIHGFVKAELVVGAKFALTLLQICFLKLDMAKVVEIYHSRVEKQRRNLDKIIDVVTPVAEEMMDELLRMVSEFFIKGSYAEHTTTAANNKGLSIDSILGIN